MDTLLDSQGMRQTHLLRPPHCIPQQLKSITTQRAGTRASSSTPKLTSSLFISLMDTVTNSHYIVFPPSFGEPMLSISFPSNHPFSLPGDPPSVARATSHIRKTSQCRSRIRQNVRRQGNSYRQATTISVLPDNVLLEIFCFYKEESGNWDIGDGLVWRWRYLVHVCRGWRQVVFASPLRLDLRIQVYCRTRTPIGKNLYIWPTLPLSIRSDSNYNRLCGGKNAFGEDNIVTALGHADRVGDVWLKATNSELEKVATVLQAQFPVLTDLYIESEDFNPPVFPAEFLGGSAPRLRTITLHGIPFPALPTLLLSTSDLTHLALWGVPQSGYFSPDALVVGLAALPRLKVFTIEFLSASPRPDQILPPPVTRTILPALTDFKFWGASEYLDDLVARIDAPQLGRIEISYLHQLVDFRIAQLAKLIDRSVGLKSTQFRYAQVCFESKRVTFHMSPHASDSHWSSPAKTEIACQGVDWQVSHIAQVLSHFSATFSNVVHLKLDVYFYEDRQLEGTDNVEWLHLLHQFSTMQTLHVCHYLAGHVAIALEDIAWEAVAQTPPSLGLLYLAGQPASSIEKFVAARQLSGRPVAVVDTEGEFYERLESHASK